jgi:predicted aldo/keto reductase-like oxidoreductase
MLYRKMPKNGDELSILRFGCMRLPMLAKLAEELEGPALERRLKAVLPLFTAKPQ